MGRDRDAAEQLVKSRQRVSDHGEVFTPRWLVDDMLDLVKSETERIDSRFLEPACGSGNFLVPVLERKLAAVQAKHGKSEFEKRHYALFALMCIYGIELLPDNAVECRENLQGTFTRYLGLSRSLSEPAPSRSASEPAPSRSLSESAPSRSLSERSESKRADDSAWLAAAAAVLEANIVQGDALAMTAADGEPITFPEWGYLGRGKFQRRDFRYDSLTQRAAASEGLFAHFEEHEIFTPVKTYPAMTVQELAA
ncbi:MAG TPA: N-6 DNA methylase [Microbacterium sp.]|nr:N-6 DNA methylase [Microbacterium sp.]